MTVTGTSKDAEANAITFTCEFDASVEQVWRMWTDPRLLERWWGPPGYPATVVDHDLSPGGVVRYFMTGPDEERYPGGFRITHVEGPALLAFDDFFENDEGGPDPNLPTSTTRVEIVSGPAGTTRMTLVTTAPTAEALAQLEELGAVDGMTGALGQVDDLLRELAT